MMSLNEKAVDVIDDVIEWKRIEINLKVCFLE